MLIKKKDDTQSREKSDNIHSHRKTFRRSNIRRFGRYAKVVCCRCCDWRFFLDCPTMGFHTISRIALPTRPNGRNSINSMPCWPSVPSRERLRGGGGGGGARGATDRRFVSSGPTAGLDTSKRKSSKSENTEEVDNAEEVEMFRFPVSSAPLSKVPLSKVPRDGSEAADEMQLWSLTRKSFLILIEVLKRTEHKSSNEGVSTE